MPRPGPGFGGPTMLALVEALEAGLATLVALTVTFAGFGGTTGAVYRPAADIVPTAALPPANPLTLHVTIVLAELVTVAVKSCVAEGATVTLVGAMLTVTGGGTGGCTVAMAVPTDDGLAALAA